MSIEVIWSLFQTQLSHVMRLWHFSSSVNSFFRCTCTAIQWGYVWWTLRLLPYFMCMCANSEGSGETARMCRLAWAFAGRRCDKYHLMSWHNWCVTVFPFLKNILPAFLAVQTQEDSSRRNHELPVCIHDHWTLDQLDLMDVNFFVKLKC